MAELIWIDSAPLIQAEHKRYLAAVKRLKDSQDRLDLHAKSDEPKYALWVQTEFAPEISSIRGLQEKYFELQAIVEFVEDCVRETGASCREAYLEYLEFKRTTELMQKMRAEHLKEEAARAERERENENEEAEEGDSDDEESGTNHHGRRSSGSHSHSEEWQSSHAARNQNLSKKALSLEADIKQIYRQLAKRLHPDINGGLSAEETEMWFEVQQAYDDRDLARLEALLALAERHAAEREENGDIAKPGKFQSLGRLKSMLKNLTRKMRNVQRNLKKAKQSPAWDFQQVKNDSRRYAKLKLEISTEFDQMVRGMNSDVRQLERLVARWNRR